MDISRLYKTRFYTKKQLRELKVAAWVGMFMPMQIIVLLNRFFGYYLGKDPFHAYAREYTKMLRKAEEDAKNKE